MSKIFFGRGSALLGAVAGLGLMAAGGLADAQVVTVTTLPPGAVNNVQAQALARVVQQKTGLKIRVATYNAPTAILGAVNTGQADFAFTSNDETGVAFRGEETHTGRAMTDLRVAATIFPFSVGIMVRADSDIKTIADLKGRKYPTGWQGFRQGAVLSNVILANAGLSLDDVDPVPAANLMRAADDFKAGKTEATAFAVGAPKVAEIHAAIGGVRFLSLDPSPEAVARMQAVRKEYHVAVTQPARFRPGIVGPTNLAEYHIVLMTGKNVPDDLVYQVVGALYGAKADLVKGHPSFGAFTDAGMAVRHEGIPYHPGAIRFFTEKGIW